MHYKRTRTCDKTRTLH